MAMRAWDFSHMSDINGRGGGREGREGGREGLIVRGHTQGLKQQANYCLTTEWLVWLPWLQMS